MAPHSKMVITGNGGAGGVLVVRKSTNVRPRRMLQKLVFKSRARAHMFVAVEILRTAVKGKFVNLILLEKVRDLDPVESAAQKMGKNITKALFVAFSSCIFLPWKFRPDSTRSTSQR